MIALNARARFTIYKINRFLVAAIGCLLTQAALAQATTTEWPTGIGFPNVARTEGELIGGPLRDCGWPYGDSRMA